jgi:phage gp29-like protein
MGLFDFLRPRSQPTGAPLLTAGATPQGPLDAQGKAAEETPQGTPPTDTFVDLPVTAMGRWNLQRIRVALDNHQMGMFADSAMLVEAMMGSGRVQTALNGRLKGITMRHLHVKPIDDSTDAKEAALWTEWLWQTVLTDEVLDQQMAWTVLEGFSLSQRCWYTREARGETVWCPKLQPWHPQFIYYDVMRRQYVAQTAEGIEYIDPEDPQWWLFTPWGEYRGWLRGALRSCAVPWAVASYALRDAGRFSEAHGMPTKVIKAPAQANAGDKSRMTSAVRGMGNSSVLFLPQQTGPEGTGWDVSLLEPRDRSWESFFALMEKCDREIQQVIRGTNLTSEVQGGSYAAAQVHADEDSGYADSDCRKLIESFRSTVQMFLGYNFGWADKCPVMWMEAPDKPDILALAQAQQAAINAAATAKEKLGWQISAPEYCERFSIPLDVKATEEAAEELASEEDEPDDVPAEEPSEGDDGDGAATEDDSEQESAE